MNGAPAVLLAAALVVLPLPCAPLVRLGAVLPRSAGPAARRSWRPPGAWVAPVAALLAAGSALGVGLPVAPAAVSGLLAGALMRALGRYARRRLDEQERDTTVEAMSVLSAELRAGQQPVDALRAAAGTARGAPAAVLATAAATARFGGSVPAVLREADGCTATAAATLRRLAAGWRLTESAGAPLCAVLEHAERSATAQRQHSRQVAALLAGPRATAVLLAALPLVGLALGAAMGARPLAVLLHSPAGQGALVTGVLLELVGLAWTDRIVRSAGAAP